MTAGAQLVLASGSPRRVELLSMLGLRAVQVAPDTDETPRPGEAPDDLVRRLAEEKAAAGRRVAGLDLPALGADTLVVVDGVPLGKPRDRSDGLAMLRRLSGRRHEVLCAVAVVGASGIQARVIRSSVTFREILPGEAEQYWATGEPRDKAGGYGIQGIGGIFVTRLEGSHSAVVGLPVAETELLLRDAGVDVWRYRLQEVGGDAAVSAEGS